MRGMHLHWLRLSLTRFYSFNAMEISPRVMPIAHLFGISAVIMLHFGFCRRSKSDFNASVLKYI